LREVKHPTAGTVRMLDSPVRFPGAEITPPPLLGEHTREVLRGLLGVDEARIARLLAAGVLATPDHPARTDKEKVHSE
jgi:crotonobetainyl-CoA:carnitine CoA-transferase CaiB-like acyl-CoA transferase